MYNINGEELAYKNKFELVSKLSSLEGIAEVSVLRKINPTNCFGSNNPELQVPYHNGIFAQNSIKLAMRRYEKPSMKSNSEADFASVIVPVSIITSADAADVSSPAQPVNTTITNKTSSSAAGSNVGMAVMDLGADVPDHSASASQCGAGDDLVEAELDEGKLDADKEGKQGQTECGKGEKYSIF